LYLKKKMKTAEPIRIKFLPQLTWPQ